ncbi:vWA domain-containing protein [Methylobacter tundripaludum]|uniref:vWA domain-containing protein n=1 Tax=Methylobacter tundripaludum TaxID=173365 RepID=UPI000488437F|nr:VWA domain-containing protein [Methylobacter tundripaludum]
MNIAEFHFIRPYWLLAVLPYLAILVLMLRNKLSQGNWSAVCDAALLPYLLQEKAVNQSRWPITAGAIAALLAIIALAGPTWERLPSPVFRNDSALVIALDLSRSMDAADIKPSRLIMARYKIADILKQRKDGQTALLVYAGDAFTVTPLTDDTETIESQLSALNTDIMPSQGSNTASALEKAVELFKQAGLQKGRILLVTDGVDMDKTLAAVKTLDKYQLSILGVGTDDGAPIALPEGGFLKDERGNIVVPKLNSSDLEKLAQAGNGVYQTITANDADIQTVLASMDRSVQQQGKQNDNLLLDQWADKGPWLLLLALPLAALTFRKGLLCFALLLILPLPKNSYALGWQDLWQTQDQQAQQAYKKQDYAKAAEQFGNPDWKAAAQYKAGEYDKALESLKSSKSASGAYNQGNALAKVGQLEEAIKAYEKALAMNPNDADAKHNKEVVEKELEKQKQEQKKQDQQKKDDKQQPKGDSEKNKEGEQSEKSDEQKQSEQKPEQKPEQKQSDQQQSEEKQQDKAGEKKPEAEKPQQAEQGKDEAKEQAKQQAPVKAEPTDEQQQANEQWLKRIPDDPAGLLKRKFKYQYGQRGRQERGDSGGW